MRFLATIIAAGLLASTALAQTQPVPPPGPARAAWQDSGRPAEMVAMDAGRKPAEVLSFMGLKRGDRVLDLVAGGGYYSEIMARVVGRRGLVVAANPPVMLSEPKAKQAWDALLKREPNISLAMVGSPDGVAVEQAKGPYDFVMMHLIYHDLYWESAKYGLPRRDPITELAKVKAMMKPGATFAVIDHVANPGGDTRAVVEQLHRIDPATIKADFAKAGFELVGESSVLRSPADDHGKLVFDPVIRGKTDRVVYRFRKPV